MTTAEIALRTLASLARVLSQAIADGQEISVEQEAGSISWQDEQGYTRREPDGSYHLHVHVAPNKSIEKPGNASP